METSLYKFYKKYWNYEENTSFHFKKTFFLKSYFFLSHFFKTLALKISAVNWCKKKYFYIYLCGNLQRTRTYTFFDNSLRNMGCRCLKILFRGSCCIITWKSRNKFSPPTNNQILMKQSGSIKNENLYNPWKYKKMSRENHKNLYI